MRYYQGKFKIKNKEKYVGDPDNIQYRSSWELKVLRYCDNSPEVLKFSSEEHIVPYRSPVDGKYHRYFVDFYIERKTSNGSIEKLLVEVKPAKQTQPPTKKTKKNTKAFITEVTTWGINSAKWKAANEYCADRGWKFEIWTEKELGIKW